MYRTILIFFILFSVNAYSQTSVYEVNLLDDSVHGSCDTLCSFRDAIIAAADDAGPSQIIFNVSVTGTIVLSNSLNLNSSNLEIIGPGPDILTISGNNNFRVLNITSVNISVSGLTITNGAGVPSGAGISITANNTILENLRIINNTATIEAAGINAFFASATLRNCEISGNTAPAAAGMKINGGVNNDILLENVTISGNAGGNSNESGIAIFTNNSQNVTLRYVTVAANSGSISAATFAGVGNTVIEASIFADNLDTDQDIDLINNVTVNNSILESLNGTVIGMNNITGQDPKLSALTFVAGSVTKVHSIIDAASVAYNHVDINIGDAQCGMGVTQDQTGFPRPIGASCDAGAFELDFVDMLFKNSFE